MPQLKRRKLVEVRKLENKTFVIGRYEDVVCVCSTKNDAQELFIDLLMEDQHETFNLLIQEGVGKALALKASTTNYGYWIAEVPFLC